MIAKIARFLPRADLDLREAREWFDEQRVGLGSEFFDDIDQVLASVILLPGRFKQVLPGYHRALLKRLKYQIVYRYEDDCVTVLAIYHTSRDPRGWIDRVSTDAEKRDLNDNPQTSQS